MAEYKFQKEVREKAENFKQSLQASGYEAAILENTYRDYTVKVSVGKPGMRIGDLIIYYKPNQKKYTLGTHETKIKDAIPDLERIWHDGENPPVGIPEDVIRAYVDGSFLDGRIGYGAVILQGGHVLQEISGGIEDGPESLLSMNQVGGEIQSVYEVLAWAVSKNISEIEIFYDYEGLEFWANGSWKVKNPQTAKYQAYFSTCPVRVVWHKVTGHSGDRWNDHADELARKGSLINKQPAPDPLMELSEQSKAFVAFLAANGLDATFEKIYNGQHSRILFASAPGKNMLDIYNTKKAPLDAKWHGFSNKSLMEEVKNMWGLFRKGGKVEDDGNMRQAGLFHDIGHYLEVLRPYKGLRFDFIDLALKVQKLVIEKKGITTDIDELRHNYDLIEKTYIQLKGDDRG